MPSEVLNQDEIFKSLAAAVISFDKNRAEDLAHQVIDNNFDAYAAINRGLFHGMEVIGKKFDQGECFVPELLMASKALMSAVEILKPSISGIQIREKAVFVIGTVKGDVHDIGKSIVAILMESSGFEVHNLGVNVEHAFFIEKAEEHNADFIGLSALMSTTMQHMPHVIELLKKEGLREKYLIMVGGAPVSQQWSDKIGSDGFAPNAARAVEVAQNLLKARRQSAK